jgi:hypothetical protein
VDESDVMWLSVAHRFTTKNLANYDSLGVGKETPNVFR